MTKTIKGRFSPAKSSSRGLSVKFPPSKFNEPNPSLSLSLSNRSRSNQIRQDPNLIWWIIDQIWEDHVGSSEILIRSNEIQPIFGSFGLFSTSSPLLPISPKFPTPHEDPGLPLFFSWWRVEFSFHPIKFGWVRVVNKLESIWLVESPNLSLLPRHSQ